MVEDKDRIAVALSGGKDSSALLFILHKILAGRNIELVALTVDEGIKGYRDQTMRSAAKIAAMLGIEHEVISFQEEFGINLDEAVQRSFMPCTICGVFRRNILNRAAKKLGATKLATGHNLDDEVQSIMINYLQGDLHRLVRFRPRRNKPGLVPRIKPLQEIPEKEVALYGLVMGFYESSEECPYARLSLRSDVRSVMNRLESQFPGTKQSTLNGYKTLMKLAEGQMTGINLSSCKICGEPCVQEICKACEILDKLRS